MEKPRKKIEQAIKAGNVAEVRRIVLDIIVNKAGKTGTLESVQYAMVNAPGLFQPDDGKTEILERDRWSRDYARRLADSLSRNFSREKLSKLLDVSSAMAQDPASFRAASGKGAEEDAETDLRRAENVRKGETIAQEVYSMQEEAKRNSDRLKKEMLQEAESYDVPESECDDESVPEAAPRTCPDGYDDDHTSSRHRTGKIIGYIIMLLGLAAAIVGLCIPLTFLTGIGIGVLMLGSLVTYLSIRS